LEARGFLTVLISIDFDDTLTADAVLWLKFIESAKALGHRCICITARRQTEENIETIDDWMTMHGVHIPVYFTGLSSKVEHAKKLGLKVDIWIDDDPKRAALGH
jgi:hypothetical protein